MCLDPIFLFSQSSRLLARSVSKHLLIGGPSCQKSLSKAPLWIQLVRPVALFHTPGAGLHQLFGVIKFAIKPTN